MYASSREKGVPCDTGGLILITEILFFYVAFVHFHDPAWLLSNVLEPPPGLSLQNILRHQKKRGEGGLRNNGPQKEEGWKTMGHKNVRVEKQWAIKREGLRNSGP